MDISVWAAAKYVAAAQLHLERSVFHPFVISISTLLCSSAWFTSNIWSLFENHLHLYIMISTKS